MSDSRGVANRPTFNANTPLPDGEEILRLWDVHQMLPGIRRHSRVVCAVALLVTDWLADAGRVLHREAVRAGALLHDLAKTACLGTERRHDLEGRKLLERAGYPELGFLVGAHVILPADQPLDEVMLVNYADKRVNHEEVVDLDRRFAYIAERYGQGEPELLERIELGRRRAHKAQRSIFRIVGPQRRPEDVQRGYTSALEALDRS